MPQRYLDNIVDYVRGGGALLAAVGPAFAGPLSLGNTSLGDILPAMPSGRVTTDAYRPAVTAAGRRHPVTAGLPAAGTAAAATWGTWPGTSKRSGAGGCAGSSSPAARR